MAFMDAHVFKNTISNGINQGRTRKVILFHGHKCKPTLLYRKTISLGMTAMAEVINSICLCGEYS